MIKYIYIYRYKHYFCIYVSLSMIILAIHMKHSKSHPSGVNPVHPPWFLNAVQYWLVNVLSGDISCFFHPKYVFNHPTCGLHDLTLALILATTHAKAKVTKKFNTVSATCCFKTDDLTRLLNKVGSGATSLRFQPMVPTNDQSPTLVNAPRSVEVSSPPLVNHSFRNVIR